MREGAAERLGGNLGPFSKMGQDGNLGCRDAIKLAYGSVRFQRNQR